MLKLKLQYFGHLMWRADSFEKTLMLVMIEGRRRKGWQRMIWLDGITDSMDMSLGGLRELVMDREAGHPVVHGITNSQTWLSTVSCFPTMHTPGIPSLISCFSFSGVTRIRHVLDHPEPTCDWKKPKQQRARTGSAASWHPTYWVQPPHFSRLERQWYCLVSSTSASWMVGGEKSVLFVWWFPIYLRRLHYKIE